jgi:hypothetical protein
VKAGTKRTGKKTTSRLKSKQFFIRVGYAILGPDFAKPKPFLFPPPSELHIWAGSSAAAAIYKMSEEEVTIDIGQIK